MPIFFVYLHFDISDVSDTIGEELISSLVSFFIVVQSTPEERAVFVENGQTPQHENGLLMPALICRYKQPGLHDSFALLVLLRLRRSRRSRTLQRIKLLHVRVDRPVAFAIGDLSFELLMLRVRHGEFDLGSLSRVELGIVKLKQDVRHCTLDAIVVVVIEIHKDHLALILAIHDLVSDRCLLVAVISILIRDGGKLQNVLPGRDGLTSFLEFGGDFEESH